MVKLSTSARVHINSIKMNTSGCWGGGGIGFSLNDPEISIDASKSNEFEIICNDLKFKEILEEYLQKARQIYKIPGLKISVLSSYSVHHGLGSETQSAMLIGKAINEVYKKNLTPEQVSKDFGVAGVSGIGYFGYLEGGFIVESGYEVGENAQKKDFSVHSLKPPVLICNPSFPKEIKVLLIVPKKSPTLYYTREYENKLFKKHTPISDKEVGEITTLLLEGVLPGIILSDYEQITKNLMAISVLGTKKVELELNKKNLFEIQNKIEDFIDFKYKRLRKAKFSLINRDKKKINYFTNSSSNKIKYSKTIPWLGLSSLGSSLYSFIDPKNKKAKRDVGEIKEILKNDAQVILTTVNNEGNKF